MTDFTNCPIVPGRAYNGANGSMIAVEYGGGIYMLKFPPSGERKPTNLSYTNGLPYIREVVSNRIYNLISDYGGHLFSTGDRHACGIKSAIIFERS